MTDIMKWKVMQLQFQCCKPKLMLYAETVMDGYSHNGLNIIGLCYCSQSGDDFTSSITCQCTKLSVAVQSSGLAPHITTEITIKCT